ncbi:MAG: helix-turn-helix domain-containing protein [Brevundimonas sp.]|jgi:transcriptional regulator with XRE-family HTH domain|uniref:helix-turn-helix domain-containing protein n=1 Tax=Brevundimonas sp. TaxID=1871086 RepID=UPI0022C09C05|nr:helix-turn-helix transcriptional regulator [Brevundimonas sp.]
MIKTPPEILLELAGRLRDRRIALGWTQTEAASRAGVAHRTWRRLETEGRASLNDMVRAAVALRCEQDLEKLFRPPPASSLDDLLARQASSSAPARRQRVRRPRSRTAGAP